MIRGLDLETDANYANNQTNAADVLTWTIVGNLQRASVSGTVMSPTSATLDVDRFVLGGLNAGNVVELMTRLPSTSTLLPVVRVLDSTGQELVDEDGDATDGHFLATVSVDETYVAEVSSRPYWIRGGTRYELLDPTSWTAAEAEAVSQGGHLVKINDQAKYDLVQSFVGWTYFWIGLNDIDVEGTFVWSDGTPASFFQWGRGEPDSRDTFYQSSGFWYDASSSSNFPALIEVPDPSGVEGSGAGPRAQYVLDVEITDPVPPRVSSLSRLPSAGGSTSSLITTFSATMSEVLDAATVNVDSSWDVRAAGADAVFDTADDVVYDLRVSPAYAAGTEVDLLVADGPLAPGHYRLRVASTVEDVVGNALDGNGDGVGGDAFVHVFDVALPAEVLFEGNANDDRAGATALSLVEDPAGSGHFRTVQHGAGSIDPVTDEDWWSFTAQAGDRVAVWVAPTTSNRLYAYLYNDVNLLAGADATGPGTVSYVSHYQVNADGTYYVRVDHRNGDLSDYAVHVEVGRGIDLESDESYTNSSSEDPLTLAQSGTMTIASVAGTVMSPESSILDVDRFALGGLNAGNVVELTTPAAFEQHAAASGTGARQRGPGARGRRR